MRAGLIRTVSASCSVLGSAELLGALLGLKGVRMIQLWGALFEVVDSEDVDIVG